VIILKWLPEMLEYRVMIPICVLIGKGAIASAVGPTAQIGG